MSDEYVMIDCPDGHQFMARKAQSEVKGPVWQQLACPTCGRRWEAMLPHAIDLTGREL